MHPRPRVEVLALSSGGGHWIQLLRLRPAFEGLNIAFASIYPDYRHDVSGFAYFTFQDAHRKRPLSFIPLALQLYHILRQTQPRLIITTGSAPALLAILIGKLFYGSRSIWIDSIANCEQMSGSGRIAKRLANITASQWQHVAQSEDVAFWGAVL